jgi:hypothetical protein
MDGHASDGETEIVIPEASASELSGICFAGQAKNDRSAAHFLSDR